MKKLAGTLFLILAFASVALADSEDTAVFRGRMVPENEVPALSVPGASANYTATVRAVRDARAVVTAATVIFEVDYTVPSNHSTIVGLHIHNGPAGANAGVVFDTGVSGVNPVIGTSGRITRIVDVPANRLQFVSGVLANPELYYINLHTSVNTGGLIRDQLKRSSLQLRTAMSPAKEVPAIPGLDAEGVGLVTIAVNRDASGTITSGSVTFDMDYRFPGGVTITGLHIHSGASTVSGGIVIDSGLSSTNVIASSSGRGNIFRVADVTSAAGLQTLASLLADPSQFYVNLHTTDNPGGAIRGQLEKDVLAFLSFMTGAEENPPVAAGGTAKAFTIIRATRDAAGNVNGANIDWNAEASFPGGPITFTGFHIHSGLIGLNGPVLLNSGLGGGANSVTFDNGIGIITRRTTIASTDTNGILALNGLFADPTGYYINLHTTVFGGGVVREQLARETYHYRIEMSPANEVPPVTSNASGVAWITARVSRDGTGAINGGSVTFDVNFDLGGAGSINGLHIHRGSAVVSGPVVIDSGIKGSSPIATTGSGNVTFTADITSTSTTALDALNDLIKTPAGFYANIHTVTNPGGVMRGQLLPMLSLLNHVVGGGDWTSAITVTNTSMTSSAIGEAVFADASGNLLPIAVTDPTLTFTIPPGGSANFATNFRGSLVSGLARVYSNVPVTTTVGYFFPGIAPAARAATTVANAVSLPISIAGARNTGVAIVNLSASDVTLGLTARTSGDAVQAIRAMTLASGQKISAFVSELLPQLGSFDGTLTIEATLGPFPAGPIAVLGLQFDSGSVTPTTITVVR